MFKQLIKLLSISVFAFMCINSTSSLANDFNHLDDLVVKQLVVGKDSVYIGFEETPKGCDGSYNGFHGEMSKQTANYSSTYISLVKAKSSKKPVSVDFYIRGDCRKASGEESLLLIEKITF